MRNRKTNKKLDYETRLMNSSVNAVLHFMHVIASHAPFSKREMVLSGGSSSKSIRKNGKSITPYITTIHKNVLCCLNEMEYTFFFIRLLRTMLEVIINRKNLVLIIVDEEDMKKYSKSHVILKKKVRKRRKW